MFAAHVRLLQRFVALRGPIVDRIQELLNAQRRPSHDRTDASRLLRLFEDCFYTLSELTPDQAALRGRLQQAHWASGFKPRDVPGNDLVDPAQMMIRAFHLWDQTRWPGRNGRLRYAHTLFNLFLLRCLELLSLRIWDDASGNAGEHLAQVQGVLDSLWAGSPSDQPVLVRDARWLIPLAQSPTTDELAPYFVVAQHIAEDLPHADRLQVHRAAVLMAGGHLRSQLRHYCIRRGVPLAENSLVLSSRNTNALDFAITIQGLVPLLDAYEQAVGSGERRARLELASTICQGISADPELFVNRVDLLGAYSMIEDLFVATAGGHAVLTPIGMRHLQLLQDYAGRIVRLAPRLREDLPNFRPRTGACSPYGLIFGFSSNLTEHMAFKTLLPDAVLRFSLEDAFSEGNDGAERLEWVSGWRRLPHVSAEVQRRFEYPQQFAQDIFDRMHTALESCVSLGGNELASTGHVFIGTGDAPELPDRYIESSAETRVLHDRREGMFLVSYQTPAGWVGITKDILTEILARGQDVRIVGLPTVAAEVVRLMYPGLVA